MKKLLAILTTFFCTFSMSAQIPLEGTEKNPTVITLGECYQLPTDFFMNAYFTFTAEADGVLYLTLSQPIKIFGKGGPLPIFGKECVQGMRKGETYTFYNTSTWGDSITMIPFFVEGKPYLPVDIISTSIANGSTYRTTLQDGDITFAFNVAINAAKVRATLTLNSGKNIELNSYRTSEDYNTLGTNYVLQLAATYNSLVEDGSLKPGDTFTITLNDIVSQNDATNSYDGEITLKLTASEKVVRLESISQNDKLMSYYMPGNEEGLITLTFSREVTCNEPHATLSYGDREAGTWTEVPVPYTISGNTITWNVQGIHLTNVPADNEGNRYVSISLKNICDKDGFPIESNAEGTTGTILFSYLVETMNINIYPDFMPSAGSNIDETKEVEIWISAGKYLTFTGAQITYQKEGKSTTEIIPMEVLRLEDDPYSETDLLVYVPIESYPFEAGEVTIELTGVAAANGTSPEIKAVYTSEGGRVDRIIPTLENGHKIGGIWTIDGVLTPHRPLKKGIYLQQMPDRKVRKLILK